MINRIMKKIISPEINYTPEYIHAIENRVSNFLEYSQLPKVFMQDGIDMEMAPARLRQLYENRDEIIESNGRCNQLIQLSDYRESGYITSAIIESYVVDCIKADKYIKTILYIDTNLLLNDYKRLIGISESPITYLQHDMEILNKEIFTADFIFWDKFVLPITGDYSQFQFSKLYDILSIRYRNCVGNMFFVNMPIERLPFNHEFWVMMNVDNKNILNFQNDSYKHLDRSN